MLTLVKYSSLSKGDIFTAQDREKYKAVNDHYAVAIDDLPFSTVYFHPYDPVLIGEEEDTIDDRLLKKLFFHTYESSRPFLGERGLMYNHIKSLFTMLSPFIANEVKFS